MLRYDYPMMVPPFEVKDYSIMTPKEAKQNFDWFVGEVPNRIRLLLGAIEYSETAKLELFDKTPQSLVVLWEWIKPRLQTIRKSDEELERVKEGLPEWIQSDMQTWKFDAATLTLIVDASLYFAEVFLTKYPDLHWSLVSKPKSDVYFHKAVIAGFKGGSLQPPTVIFNLCSSYIEGNFDKTMLSLFQVWENYV